MNVEHLEIPDIIVLELDRHSDERGWFMEFWNPSRIDMSVLPRVFVQDNIAHSKRGVVRGLHFQFPNPQAKLVTVTDGEVYDVAVDVRSGSSTFGKWVAQTLVPGIAMFVPEGFAHGYQVLSDTATVFYKCTDYYHPESEHALVWNDPVVNIQWPIAEAALSPKDRHARTLDETRAVLERLTPTQ